MDTRLEMTATAKFSRCIVTGPTWTVLAAAVLMAGAAEAGDCAKAVKAWHGDLSMAGAPEYGPETCTLLAKVIDAFALLDTRDLPNSQARSGRSKKTDTVRAVQTLLAGQRMTGLAVTPSCRMLRDVAAKTGDFSVALHAIELVTLIDAAQGTCSKSLNGALADNPDAAGILEQAADLCTSRKEPHCALLGGTAK